MGREVKRVDLADPPPMGETWPGYINPHYRRCPACGGDGESVSGRALGRLVQLLMLAGGDSAAGKPPHPYLVAAGVGAVGPDLHEVTAGLAGRSPMRNLLGHDALDRWRATAKVKAAAGLPEGWGTCPTCAGHGEDPETKEASDAWERTDPPAGAGWQMWETTSEGSPISPAFATAPELARWLADTGASSFGDCTATYEDWLAVIEGSGHAVGAVVTHLGIEDGVTAEVRLRRKREGDA